MGGSRLAAVEDHLAACNDCRGLVEQLGLAQGNETPASALPRAALSHDLSGADHASKLGRYTLLECLGSGGMGSVYLAYDPVLDRRVALKSPHASRDRKVVRMFYDEARLCAQIDHPNIVQAYDVEEADGETFLVMEYLDGEALRDIMAALTQQGRRLDLSLAVHITAEVAAGLQAAHDIKDADGRPRNLVHRDVSPQNIVITYDGRVKLLDFGIAKANDRLTHTQTGLVKGKAAYMSPEQIQNLDLDGRADIFSLGVVLYEMITGQRLFERDSSTSAIRAILQEALPEPTTIRSECPKVLASICMRALSRPVEARQETAAILRQELLTAQREFHGTEIPEIALALMMQDLFGARIAGKSVDLQTIRDRTSSERKCPESQTRTEANAIAVDLVQNPAVRSPGRLMAVLAGGLGGIALAAGLFLLPNLWRGPAHQQPLSLPQVQNTPLEARPIDDPEPADVTITVESRPSGASISIAGKLVGTTPGALRIEKASTPVRLDFRLPGYLPRQELVRPDVDQRLLIDFGRKSQAEPKPVATRSKKSPRKTKKEVNKPSARGTPKIPRFD
ncbi:MAG: serine/threonine-protein kinase [Myxococcota bacterium]